MSSEMDESRRARNTAPVATLLPHPLSGLFDDRRARVLIVLLAADTPLSGREILRRAGVSATTVGAGLDDLRKRGLASAAPHGRAVRWRVDEESALVDLVRRYIADVDAQATRSVLDILGEEPQSLFVFGSTAGRARRQRYREQAATVARSLRHLLAREAEVVVIDSTQLREDATGSFVRNLVDEGRTVLGAPMCEFVGELVAG